MTEEDRKGSRRRWATLLAIAALYWALPNARLDFTRYNSHDSENYLALSYSLSHGRGYTRSLEPGPYVAHEMWPPGWPALLTLATVGAEDRLQWTRVKLTVATLGVVGLAPLWLWVRRFASAAGADAATLAVALNPLYWHFSHQAMAEVPLFLSVVGGLLWIDRLWRDGCPTPRAAAGAGLCCGLAMLIKGHAVVLALVPFVYVLAARKQQRRTAAARALLFATTFALPFSIWIGRNVVTEAPGIDGFSQLAQIRTGDPMNPESASRGPAESTVSVFKKFRRHAIYRIPEIALPGLWKGDAFDWSGSGWLALPLTGLLFAGGWSRRPAARGALLAAAGLSLLNLNYGYGGATRFWIPVGLLLLALLAARTGQLVGSSSSRIRRLVGWSLAIALSLNLAAYIRAHERAPYNPTGPWAELVDLFDEVRSHPFESAGVLTPNPRAFQLWTGVPAPMTTPETRYQHLVTRSEAPGPEAPHGARLVIERPPWKLWELPEPRTVHELTGEERARYSMTW